MANPLLSIRARLRRLTRMGLLLREVRSLHQELAGVHAVGERIAAALEASNAHQWPQQLSATPDQPPVEVTYVNNAYQEEVMDIETRLTAARGAPPSEEEILAEFVRRHPDSDVALEFGSH